jgi:tRNA (cytidine/uridine-2'-O-)-methyltransferase
MIDVVLYEPEIPPNTGNIIRLCANTGFALHLIAPLGFDMQERRLRRAGLDYREWARVRVHDSLDSYLNGARSPRLLAFSTRGARDYASIEYRRGDALLFGPETRGLPKPVLDRVAPAERARIPMQPGNRSLNLSNAVAVVCYEAWRQHGFARHLAGESRDGRVRAKHDCRDAGGRAMPGAIAEDARAEDQDRQSRSR